MSHTSKVELRRIVGSIKLSVYVKRKIGPNSDSALFSGVENIEEIIMPRIVVWHHIPQAKRSKVKRVFILHNNAN